MVNFSVARPVEDVPKTTNGNLKPRPIKAKFYRTGLGGVPVLGRLENAGASARKKGASSTISLERSVLLGSLAGLDPAGGSDGFSQRQPANNAVATLARLVFNK